MQQTFFFGRYKQPKTWDFLEALVGDLSLLPGELFGLVQPLDPSNLVKKVSPLGTQISASRPTSPILQLFLKMIQVSLSQRKRIRTWSSVRGSVRNATSTWPPWAQHCDLMRWGWPNQSRSDGLTNRTCYFVVTLWGSKPLFLIIFLGWTSIYQLFWCHQSTGVLTCGHIVREQEWTICCKWWGNDSNQNMLDYRDVEIEWANHSPNLKDSGVCCDISLTVRGSLNLSHFLSRFWLTTIGPA